MKQATAGDKADWFSPPPDVQKVTVCRLSGQLATDACRHGWAGADYVQAGLSEMPGVPAGPPLGTSARRAAAPTVAMVYDDYFPIGSAPTESCPIHGNQGIVGTTGLTDADGLTAVSYTPPAQSRIQKVIGPDGRAVWVIR